MKTVSINSIPMQEILLFPIRWRSQHHSRQYTLTVSVSVRNRVITFKRIRSLLCIFQGRDVECRSNKPALLWAYFPR